MVTMVTGATGLIGSAVVSLLNESGKVVAPVRRLTDRFPQGVQQVQIDDISGSTDWRPIFSSHPVDVVVHAAARVHVMSDSSSDPIIEYRRVNTEGTIQIARQAAEAGVKRFIFISSIKVNGEFSEEGKPFQPDDAFIPSDPYALSKYEAEQELLKMAATGELEIVIIRPPLVYGPGVKANFRALIRLVRRGVPLPFGSVHNKRSLVALENLVDFIRHCVVHPDCANQIFLISDGIDVSTTELIRKMARAMNRPPRLLPVPVWLLKVALTLLGKSEVATRLFGSLQVDSTKARRLAGWEPVISMDEQLKKIIEFEVYEESI